MRAKWLLLMILVVFIGASLSSVLIMNTKVDMTVNMVAVNDLVKKVESNWGAIEKGDYSGSKQPFTVMDHSGTAILFQSNEGPLLSLHDAIKNRYTIVDITIDNTLQGKLIIQTTDKQSIERSKQQLIIVICATFAAIILLSFCYTIYLNTTVFRPFHKLQSFAQHVARGNLDIPLKMDRNNPFGAFTESFDLMREQLASARTNEYLANRSKKELVASLSHDIKTPVASIKAVSELMLLRATEEKELRQLTVIYSKAEQINLLVTDMFLATLEELNELKVTVAVELSDVLYEMIATVNYDDQIVCHPIPSCMLLTDKIRLQQVLDNILSNAYKYAGSSIAITSSLRRPYLELSIKDYGRGVHSEELPLLFNKYYRGKNVETKSGSGLGLYISKTLMESMNGDIECHNREDGFTVTLKIKLA